jgi:hypothetical protein
MVTTAATTASVAAASSIVLSKTILKTLAPSMIHARMKRARCININGKVET